MPTSFTVRPEWHAAYDHRWRTARRLLTAGLFGAQAVLITATATTLALADWRMTAMSMLAVVPPAAYLTWFVGSRRYLQRTTFWTLRVLDLGMIQLFGIAFPAVFATADGHGWAWGLLAPEAIAVAGCAVATHRAHDILFGHTRHTPSCHPLHRQPRSHARPDGSIRSPWRQPRRECCWNTRCGRTRHSGTAAS